MPIQRKITANSLSAGTGCDFLHQADQIRLIYKVNAQLLPLNTYCVHRSDTVHDKILFGGVKVHYRRGKRSNKVLKLPPKMNETNWLYPPSTRRSLCMLGSLSPD